MERQGEKIHVETDEARGGSTPHVTRWVLGISLLAAIVVLSLVWIIPALTQGDTTHEPTATSAQVEETEGDDTDSIVSDNFDDSNTPPAESGGMDVIDN